MATLTYGPGLALGGFFADNSPAGIANTLSNFINLTFLTEQSSVAIGDYRRLNNPAFQDYFLGSGFTYSLTGVPTGGTITEFRRYYNGQLVSDFVGTTVPVPTLEAWVQSGSYALAGATMFAGDDTVVGTSGNDILDGYGGSNILVPGTGADRLIGGSGIDTVILPDTIREDSLAGSPINSATVNGPDISDSLTSIERIQFVDGTKYFDVSSPAAQIARMYQAALGRNADPGGLANWVAALKGGAAINQIAASFIASEEFQIRFPGISQTAGAFVTQLYANVLHRTPDSGGFSAWVGILQSGTQTQGAVLVGFSESQENQINTAGLLQAGIWVADEQAASVARLYYSALNRAPDANGLIGWTHQLETGALTLQQEADQFVASTEFQQKYGALSNTDFISLMYTNVLGRQSDSAGAAAWENALNTGSSRAGVLVGFSESAEHQIGLASKIEMSGIVLA
jgi:hypothetical protein